ncbi:MAG: hypothetical protein LUD01_02080, partial [Clostridiales bacterium]|nr:hypothetical protein [Clostridiales bacterium]
MEEPDAEPTDESEPDLNLFTFLRSFLTVDVSASNNRFRAQTLSFSPEKLLVHSQMKPQIRAFSIG